MKSSYHHYDGYVIRKPAFSYDILFSTDSTTKDLDELVVELINNESFLNAIFWSSLDLYRAIIKYKEGLITEDRAKKILTSLKKYIIRGCTRSTPYGTLSGCTFLQFEENRVFGANHKARIDMGLLEKIKLAIESNANIKYYLQYTLNNTLYEKGNYIKFLEQQWNCNKKEFKLSAIENTDYIKVICKRLKNKFLPINEIKDIFRNEFDDEEIQNFTEALVESGLLISELEIVLTSADYLEDVLNTLRRLEKEGLQQVGIYIAIFEKIQNCIYFINSNSHSLPLEEINLIEQLLYEVNIMATQIFHIDLRVANNKTEHLDQAVIKNIFDAIDFLRKINAASLNADKDLEEFKKLYRLRFESQEIPLTVALDRSCGIGFPVGDSIGSDYESQIFDFGNSNNNLKKIDGLFEIDWLWDKLESVSANHTVIELTNEDIKDKHTHLTNLSYNFSVVGSYCQNNNFFLQSVTNGSALSLMGRFAYLETGIKKLCEDIAKDEIEHETDAILAEILFLPEGRVGNICRHPSFYKYEIPIITESALPNKNQIYAQDLMVSVVNNEIILRSKTLNKRVIPRLSNAHNFTNSQLALYKFLSSLQYQGFPSIGFRSNYTKNKKRFFPRIVYKDIILHRATWILTESDIKTILKATSPQAKLVSFLKARQVCRFVVLVEQDNELFVDLENESFQNLIIEELKASTSIQLTEWVYDVGFGANINQFVIPLKNTACQTLQNSLPLPLQNSVDRSFPPGSEWLYLKIYCSTFISDDLLVVLSYSLDNLKDKSVLSEYFFIRYTDPHYHLRIRMKILDIRLMSEALKFIQQQLRIFEEEGTIWKTSVDTYEREIERYGEIDIEDTERLFFYDSKLVLSFICDENFRDNEIDRIILAVLNIDNYLTFFNLKFQEKFLFCKKMEFAFEKEFDGQNKKDLYNKYREFSSTLYSQYRASHMNEIFQNRTNKISTLRLSKDRISDYIHMSINRWFPGQQRFYEYMCYIFATKLYNRLLNEENV